MWAVDMGAEVSIHDQKTNKKEMELLKQVLLSANIVSADGQYAAEGKRLAPHADEVVLQMEVLEMVTSGLLKSKHKNVKVSDFSFAFSSTFYIIIALNMLLYKFTLGKVRFRFWVPGSLHVSLSHLHLRACPLTIH